MISGFSSPWFASSSPKSLQLHQMTHPRCAHVLAPLTQGMSPLTHGELWGECDNSVLSRGRFFRFTRTSHEDVCICSQTPWVWRYLDPQNIPKTPSQEGMFHPLFSWWGTLLLQSWPKSYPKNIMKSQNFTFHNNSHTRPLQGSNNSQETGYIPNGSWLTEPEKGNGT